MKCVKQVSYEDGLLDAFYMDEGSVIIGAEKFAILLKWENDNYKAIQTWWKEEPEINGQLLGEMMDPNREIHRIESDDDEKMADTIYDTFTDGSLSDSGLLWIKEHSPRS